MRIFTYPNPFEISRNKELWSIVTKHPHYCASDTLVQGLEAEYGRNSFGFLRTANVLADCVLGSFINNPQNDIQMFLTISNIIREIKDSDTKAAFRFNIAEVAESVRFLLLLGCESTKFKGDLTGEQKILLEIYEKVLNSGAARHLENIKQMSKTDFIIAARSTINDEITYLCNRSPEYLQLGFKLPLVTPKDGYEAINEIIEYLSGKTKEAPNDAFTPLTYLGELEKAKHILKLVTQTDDSVFDRIIIHGVHKITPVMYFLFKFMESIGVEIIFLINYAKNLPNVYKTWKEVYSWCDTKFEYQEDLNIASGKNLGSAIAGIIEGKQNDSIPAEEVTVFNNLTSFTDREVRTKFKAALKKVNVENPLNKMDTQYYAVRGKSSNEILKIYFPEQFNQKPFLSYPVGQFILGIYQMWDFDKSTLSINDQSLCECAVSNIYKGSGLSNIFEIIKKTKLYFSNVTTINEYYKRIKELETSLQIISRNNKYSSLQKLSFFNITFAELAEFRGFLEFVEGVANKLFKDANHVVDFGKHFKTLIEIISIPSIGGVTLTKTEQALISEITSRLDACTEGEVTGHIQDVKDALCFYLAASKKGDTSNWIVRDFEQIDGAVLLRKISKAKYYHFAMLSNSHMTNQNDDALTWPLTDEMFIGYADAESAVPVITRCILERRNFLKFSLFYGTFFTKCGIKLSYIGEENGEEQTPYYLLNVLGLRTHIFQEEEATSFLTDKDKKAECKSFSSEKLLEEVRDIFSICPYRFLLNEVLKAPIEYFSDYHVKYYVSNFMYTYIKSKHNILSKNISKVIKSEFELARKLFPFWDKAVFLDIEKNTRKQLDTQSTNNQADMFAQQTYEIRKENFLIAQWTDPQTQKKMMNFRKQDLAKLLTEYMTGDRLYPGRSELPHKKVCENCNFGEICLRDYYEANAAFEGDDELA